MAIVAGDIEYRLSGGASESDPNLSLGGVVSSVEVVDASDNNLFADVSGDDASSGVTHYRLIYVYNNHGSLTLQGAKVWISTDTTSSDDEIDIALAGEGLNVNAETIADEDTAPVGESFTHPTTKAGGLTLGDIPAGQYFGVWIRRVVGSSASAIAANSGIISVEGDTAA